MRFLLFFVALTFLALAQGMFDLAEGTWVGKTPAGQSLQLHTGGKEHDFELHYGEHWVVRGEYRVTATKGQPHVSFKPAKILQDGHTRKYVEIEKWPLVVGRESKAILDYQGKRLQLDVFGPEIENYWRAELLESGESSR